MLALPVNRGIIREGCCQGIAGIGNDRFNGLQCIMTMKELGEACVNKAILNASLI